MRLIVCNPKHTQHSLICSLVSLIMNVTHRQRSVEAAVRCYWNEVDTAHDSEVNTP